MKSSMSMHEFQYVCRRQTLGPAGACAAQDLQACGSRPHTCGGIASDKQLAAHGMQTLLQLSLLCFLAHEFPRSLFQCVQSSRLVRLHHTPIRSSAWQHAHACDVQAQRQGARLHADLCTATQLLQLQNFSFIYNLL